MPEPALVCREALDEALIATVADPRNDPSLLLPPDRWLPDFDQYPPHYPCVETAEDVVALWESRRWDAPRVLNVAPQWFEVRQPWEEDRPWDGDMVAMDLPRFSGQSS